MTALPKNLPATGNDALDLYLGQLRTFLAELADDVRSAREPEVHLLTGADTIKPSWDVVVYAGGGGDSIVLPSAKRIDGRRSRVLTFLNTGTGTATLVAQGGETIDGVATRAVVAGLKLGISSDGATKHLTQAANDGVDFGAFRHAPGGSGLTCHYYAGVTSGEGLVTVAPAANILRAFPFIAPRRGGTLDRLTFEVTTGVAGNGRVGLYANTADNNLYPAALLVDGGGSSTAAAGTKSATVSQVLTPGAIYWLAHVGDAAPALWCLDAGSITSMLGVPLGGNVNLGISVAFTYAALPATFPAGGAYIGTSNPPALGYRLS